MTCLISSPVVQSRFALLRSDYSLMHRRTYAEEPSDLVGAAANRVVMRRHPPQPIDRAVPFTEAWR
ncbi:MAG: hypothetical protein KGM92_20460 [Acidobacteriota bacterium]|nr:hypothetical protein [Acidobacteriota bacterium]